MFSVIIKCCHFASQYFINENQIFRIMVYIDFQAPIIPSILNKYKIIINNSKWQIFIIFTHRRKEYYSYVYFNPAGLLLFSISLLPIRNRGLAGFSPAMSGHPLMVLMGFHDPCTQKNVKITGLLQHCLIFMDVPHYITGVYLLLENTLVLRRTVLWDRGGSESISGLWRLYFHPLLDKIFLHK